MPDLTTDMDAQRHLLQQAQLTLGQFRALCILGPRQSGKTTLCKMLMPDRPYVNFEIPDIQQNAENLGAEFLNQFPEGAILDEVQRVPEIFRHLQVRLDASNERGQFLLTGSNNFLLQEKISQSLAGRVGYLSLQPFSYAELRDANLSVSNINNHILKGGYPEIWTQKTNPELWYAAYSQTYVERDVRLLRNIENLSTFRRFIRLCANHAGQLVNKEELASKTGVDAKTIQAWLGLLEAGYIAFLLPPWHNNLNKRIVKSPKLYFYDTGLLCSLLGINNETGLKNHEKYGSIFENWIITEIQKNRFNSANNAPIYFFRDGAGNEVDLIIEENGKTTAIEIKSGSGEDNGHFRSLRWFQKYQRQSMGILVYGGTESTVVDDNTSRLSWRDIGDLGFL